MISYLKSACFCGIKLVAKIIVEGDTMKVIAFNGSARKDGNTAILLNLVLDELKAEGIETELYSLAGKPVQGCIACLQML